MQYIHRVLQNEWDSQQYLLRNVTSVKRVGKRCVIRQAMKNHTKWKEYKNSILIDAYVYYKLSSHLGYCRFSHDIGAKVNLFLYP